MVKLFSDFELTTDIPYTALYGKLYGKFLHYHPELWFNIKMLSYQY